MHSKGGGRRIGGSENVFSVIVRLLEDETSEEVSVPEDATGKWLFEEVCCRQGVMEEREYFGLRYLEHQILTPPTKQWIDLTRRVLSQLKNTKPLVVSFRVKHYPPDPMGDIRLPKTCYLLYRQLRRDLVSGRLVARSNELIRLAALVVQVELGDSSVQDPPQISTKSGEQRSYLADFQVLHNQTPRTEALILEEHKKLDGLLPSEAAMEVIQVASTLETYGIDPIRVKTKSHGSRSIHLGLTHQGVAEFVSNRSQKLYPWQNLLWMTCDGKYFILAVSKEGVDKKKKGFETVSFRCETKAVARAVWEWATERQLFLTLEKSSSARQIKSKRGLFSKSHTFKFSGRCRREVLARPSLAATLPSNLSDACHVGHSGRCPPSSAGAHSLSMVALEREPSILDCSMCPIGEEFEALNGVDIPPDSRQPQLGLYSQSSISMAHLQQSTTLPSAFSEPSGRENSTPLGLDTMSQQHESTQPSPVDHVALRPRAVNVDQLAPYFDLLPKRRYLPEAEAKQRKLVRAQCHRHSGDMRNRDAFDSDDDISTELRSVVEAGQAWAAGGDLKYNKALDADSNSTRQPSTPVHHVPSAPGSDAADTACGDENASPSGSAWSTWAISTGFLTGATIAALLLLLETDVHSPVVAAIQENPWVMYFNSRICRPVLSAVSDLWRRPA